MVGATSIRISWGRSSANRHTPSLGVVATPPAFPQMGNGAYGYPTTYGDPTAAYTTAPYGTAPNDPYAGSPSVQFIMQAWLGRSRFDNRLPPSKCCAHLVMSKRLCEAAKRKQPCCRPNWWSVLFCSILRPASGGCSSGRPLCSSSIRPVRQPGRTGRHGGRTRGHARRHHGCQCLRQRAHGRRAAGSDGQRAAGAGPSSRGGPPGERLLCHRW